ncbi:MAG: ribonuclease III [Oscillospiraceae bacterium]|nr:ribonuclease III [Oscillospiraceae bacterium]MCD8344201.1 ribonuclease III [Oscillospiraceae bacterium]
MSELGKKLQYDFQNAQLALTAVTHSSYANEHHCESNERLEFLGDSVLGMVTAAHLYALTPEIAEGRMTKLRSELVCEQALHAVADRLELGQELRLGRGEESSGGRRRPSIMADCVEALIAAIYLDGGLAAAEEFICREILPALYNGEASRLTDCKTALQELVQRRPGQALSYELTGESGPDHMKRFTMTVLLNGSAIGEGTGRTKKEAEQNAAAEALKRLSAK